MEKLPLLTWPYQLAVYDPGKCTQIKPKPYKIRDVQPARRAKAHAAKSVGTSGSSLEMRASSALLGDGNTGYLSATDSIGPVHLHRDLPAAACCTQDKLAICHWLQRLPAGPFADAISELCWISFDDPTVTMECLASTAVVRVMKVCHM